jgi:hypothetical protein
VPHTAAPATATPATAAPATAAPATPRASAAAAVSATGAPRASAAPATSASAGDHADAHAPAGGVRRGDSGSPGPNTAAGETSRAPATTAYAPIARPSPAPGSASSLERLNSRFNALLPAGDSVSYSQKRYENDLGAAVAQVEQQYYQAAAPPQSVLDKAIDVVRQRGLVGPPAILYILKRQRIFGIEICTGWVIEPTATGPQGGYTVGPCGGEKFTPSGGLPTLAPKISHSPEP